MAYKSLNHDPIAERTAGAVRLHAEGAYSQALVLRMEAAELAGPDDPRYGGILSTIGATYARMGDMPRAREATALGYAILDANRHSDDPAQREAAFREFPAAALFAGSLALKEAFMQDPRLGPEVASLARDGRNKLEAAWAGVAAVRQADKRRYDPRPHQHQINVGPRLAMARALVPEKRGDRLRAARTAAATLLRGPLSESPHLALHTSGLAFQARWHAKKKAVVAGGAVTAAAFLSMFPGSMSRHMQVAIARRVL